MDPFNSVDFTIQKMIKSLNSIRPVNVIVDSTRLHEGIATYSFTDDDYETAIQEIVKVLSLQQKQLTAIIDKTKRISQSIGDSQKRLASLEADLEKIGASIDSCSTHFDDTIHDAARVAASFKINLASIQNIVDQIEEKTECVVFVSTNGEIFSSNSIELDDAGSAEKYDELMRSEEEFDLKKTELALLAKVWAIDDNLDIPHIVCFQKKEYTKAYTAIKNS